MPRERGGQHLTWTLHAPSLREAQPIDHSLSAPPWRHLGITTKIPLIPRWLPRRRRLRLDRFGRPVLDRQAQVDAAAAHLGRNHRVTALAPDARAPADRNVADVGNVARLDRSRRVDAMGCSDERRVGTVRGRSGRTGWEP